MAQVADQQALNTLSQEVESAVKTLRFLTKAEGSHLVGKSQTLPPDEIALAAGVAFMKTTKAGLIISGVSGHGILLKKVASSQSGWSAPVLFDVKSLGVGVAAGVSTSNSLLIIDTDHAVNSFLHTQVTLDSEVMVAAGRAGRQMHGSELNVSSPKDSFSGAMYTLAHGAMIDVSFQGVKISIKEQAMQKLYGTGVTSAQVLQGTVPQIPLVEPLITELQLLARGGATPASRYAERT